MRFARPLFLGVVVSALVPVAPAQAEPSRATRYLMGTPVSLMDWGLYRTEQVLRLGTVVWGGVEGAVTPSARFDWERNRVVIEVALASATRPTVGHARIACREGMQVARTALGMDGDKGTPRPGEWHVGWLFGPQAFVADDAPKDLPQQILELTELTVKIWTQKDSGRALAVRAECSGPLLGQQVNVRS